MKFLAPSWVTALFISLSFNTLGQGVGINTTSPVNMLDVEGAVAIGASYSGTSTAPTNGMIVEGNVGIGTSTVSYKLHGYSAANVDAFYFVQTNVLTGEHDVFTIEDQDNGGGGQDFSSVLKVFKSSNINAADEGASLIELIYTGADPTDNAYWISGSKDDDADLTRTTLWGVDVTDNDFWSAGGMVLGITTATDGTYSGGEFIVNETDGSTGIGTTTLSTLLNLGDGTNDAIITFTDGNNSLQNTIDFQSAGVTAPTSADGWKLRLWGAGTYDGSDYGFGINGSTLWMNTGGTDIDFYDSGSLVATIQNGNMGIGSATPATKFDVIGNVKITGTTQLNGVTYTWPGADGTNGQVLTTNGSGTFSWSTAGGSSEWTDAGAYMRPADGASERVSIGTTSGSKPFSSTFSKLMVYNNSSWLGDPNAGATVTFYNDENINSQTSHILDLQYGNTTGVGADDKFIRFIRGLGTEVGSVNSEVVYTTFTGAHVGQSDEDGSAWIPGMIVSSHGNPSNASMGRALVKIGLTKTQKDPAVIGVLSNIEFDHNHADMDTTRPAYQYNALGEGLILVTDVGGNLRIGDYITSSDRPGYGMKQDDDLLHNYTVAKATEAVNWDEVVADPATGFKWKLIACTYHGG